MINALRELRSSPLVLLVLALPVCLLLYWSGLYGPLLLDDVANFGYLLQPDFDHNILPTKLFSLSGPFGRPVAMVSFMANALWSQDLFYWKLTNFIIHLLCGLLIYGVVQHLYVQLNPSASSSLFAVVVTVIWLLHPLHISTVLYTVQRMTQLATLFTLAGLLCYLKARRYPFKSVYFSVYQALAWLLCFPLALFSKETALLFPLFAVVLEVFGLSKDRIDDKLFYRLLLGAFIAGAGVLWYKADYILGGYHTREFTLFERVLTQPRIMVSYLAMLLMPRQKQMAFLHDDFELSTDWLTPWTTLPSIIFLSLILFSAFFFRKKQPLVSIGILFFFVGHLLESTVFALEMMYEHRNYLPSVGFFLALACVAKQLITERRLLVGLTCCFLVLLSFSTWLRADIWSSNFRFLYNLETNHSNSERGAFVVSGVALQMKEYGMAREKLKSFNTLGVKIQNLYIDCLEHKKLTETQLNIDMKAFRVTDNFAMMGLLDIANLGLNKKCQFSFSAYLNLLNEVLTQTRTRRLNRQKLLMYKAHYQWRLQQKEAAFATLQQTFVLDRKNPTPLFLACEWALDENLRAKADELCPKALTIAAQNPYQFKDLAEQVKKRLDASE